MVKNRSVKETGIITDVPNAARNYKDRIFRMVFREKKALLALYNAIPGAEICGVLQWSGKYAGKRSLKTVQLICEESGTHKPGTGNIRIKCKCRL